MSISNSKKVKIAVIGFGRLGKIHAKNIANSEHASLVAVCDHNASTLSEAKQLYDVPVYLSVEELKKLSQIEAVVIATDTADHATTITQAARAGWAIFTEKPIGLTLEETDKALKEVVEAGVHFQIGFQRRWDPRFTNAKALVEAGEIGRPILYKAFGRDPNASNPGNWGLDINGGLFVNAAIHDFDAARFFFGSDPTQISATGAVLVHHGLSRVDDIDTCSTSLFFGENAMAINEWSRYAVYGYDMGFELIGTEGIIRVNLSSSTLALQRHTDTAPTLFDVFGDAFREEIEAFTNAIISGIPASPGVEDARIALHISLCAHESFKNNSSLTKIAPLFPLQAH